MHVMKYRDGVIDSLWRFAQASVDECDDITCDVCPLHDPKYGCLSDLVNHIFSNWGND